jgi:hypothetical protein
MNYFSSSIHHFFTEPQQTADGIEVRVQPVAASASFCSGILGRTQSEEVSDAVKDGWKVGRSPRLYID